MAILTWSAFHMCWQPSMMEFQVNISLFEHSVEHSATLKATLMLPHLTYLPRRLLPTKFIRVQNLVEKSVCDSLLQVLLTLHIHSGLEQKVSTPTCNHTLLVHLFENLALSSRVTQDLSCELCIPVKECLIGKALVVPIAANSASTPGGWILLSSHSACCTSSWE